MQATPQDTTANHLINQANLIFAGDRSMPKGHAKERSIPHSAYSPESGIVKRRRRGSNVNNPDMPNFCF